MKIEIEGLSGREREFVRLFGKFVRIGFGLAGCVVGLVGLVLVGVWPLALVGLVVGIAALVAWMEAEMSCMHGRCEDPPVRSGG